MSAKPTETVDDTVDTEPLDAEAAEPTAEELKQQVVEAKAAQKAAESLAAERKSTIEFWQQREAKGKSTPKAAAPVAAEPDPLEELDLVALLTEEKDPARIRTTFAKAVKAQIAAELKRGNLVSREEAEGYVAQMIEGATAMNRLVGEFPDLANPKSAFFAETQKQLVALESDPLLKGTPQNALERMAAQQAELALLKAGKTATDPDEDRYDRIAEQRGGRRGRSQAAESTTLTGAEKSMAAKLGVSEKDYLAQKTAMLRPGGLGPAMTADRMMREFGNG